MKRLAVKQDLRKQEFIDSKQGFKKLENPYFVDALGSFAYLQLDRRKTIANNIQDIKECRKWDNFNIIECESLIGHQNILYEYRGIKNG